MNPSQELQTILSQLKPVPVPPRDVPSLFERYSNAETIMIGTYKSYPLIYSKFSTWFDFGIFMDKVLAEPLCSGFKFNGNLANVTMRHHFDSYDEKKYVQYSLEIKGYININPEFTENERYYPQTPYNMGGHFWDTKKFPFESYTAHLDTAIAVLEKYRKQISLSDITTIGKIFSKIIKPTFPSRIELYRDSKDVTSEIAGSGQPYCPMCGTDNYVEKSKGET